MKKLNKRWKEEATKSLQKLHSEHQELIYGINTIDTLLNTDPSRILTIFIEKNNNDLTNKKIIKIEQIAQNQQISIQKINSTTLNKLFGEVVNHQGIVAKIKPAPFLAEEDLINLAITKKQFNPVFLVLDQIQDPRNLGACIRSAAVMGVAAVVISRHNSCDITPIVKKVASGATEIVSIAKVGNLVNCLKLLQKQGVWVVALDAGHAQSLSTIDLTIPVALVLGSEGTGIRNIIKQNSDYLAKIPMNLVGIDSLNISVAAGICLYEINRQRIHD